MAGILVGIDRVRDWARVWQFVEFVLEYPVAAEASECGKENCGDESTAGSHQGRDLGRKRSQPLNLIRNLIKPYSSNERLKNIIRKNGPHG